VAEPVDLEALIRGEKAAWIAVRRYAGLILSAVRSARARGRGQDHRPRVFTRLCKDN